MTNLSSKRRSYQPKIPDLLQDLNGAAIVPIHDGSSLGAELQAYFPHTSGLQRHQAVKGLGKKGRAVRVGVLFSGGPASGGHNVLSGLYDALMQIDPSSKLFGIQEGASGLIEDRMVELTAHMIDSVRNQGGFDLIGTSRTKIEKAEQFEKVRANIVAHKLDAIVIIGGDDSNTNGAFLAESFAANGLSTQVIGIPKTIDADLQSDDIEISFGFDTACKTYSEMIGNLCKDAQSIRKYTHFVKLMGRSASHIALECALATQPNLTLIGEEKKGLFATVQDIADLIEKRSAVGKNYGVILIPEGLIEFMPEIKQLIAELGHDASIDSLSSNARMTLEAIPKTIQNQLLLDKDPHGNPQVSKIETEKLLMHLVRRELLQRNFLGKLNSQEHFFGYEGRSCLPSNFDADYTYALGRSAALAIREGLNGVIAALKDLRADTHLWRPVFVPAVRLMTLEERHGKMKPVIKKTLVDLEQEPYRTFTGKRKSWELDDAYQQPGPIQFFGDPSIIDSRPRILRGVG